MKKVLLFLLLSLLFFPFAVSAEEINMEWQKSFGGNDIDVFSGIFQTSNDEFIVHGYSYSTDIDGFLNKGNHDVIIIKYDKDGNILWQTNWGGNGYDHFENIFQTLDGGFIGYGYSWSTDVDGFSNMGKHDAVIVKFDKDGKLLWQTSWGGNNYDHINHLFQTSDGSFIAHGYSYSTDIDGLPNKGEHDAIVLKFDKDGKLLWQISWGGNKFDHFENILQTIDGGFIGYGYSDSTDIEEFVNNGDKDAIIVKFDKEGNMMWQQNYGGNKYDHFENAIYTQDDGVIVHGYSYSTNIDGFSNKGAHDVVIVKYDKEGNMKWQKSWGGNNYDQFENILQTLDGGFIGYGYSWSTDINDLLNKGEHDAVIVKFDKEGNMMWQKSWGGNNFDNFDNVLQIQDGGLITFGYSYSTDIDDFSNKGEHDIIVIKYDKDGNLLWQKSFGGNKLDHFENVMQTLDGGFIGIGYTDSTDIDGLSNHGGKDALIVKYNFKYNFENTDNENGLFTVEQQGKYGIIKVIPNEGYEVDKIIIKDKIGNILDVEVIKLESEKYSFELYSDVIIDVVFKEEVVNPKTGVFDYVLVLFGIVILSLILYFTIIKYESKRNLNLGI